MSSTRDSFGEDHAAIYDELLGELPDVKEVVSRLGHPGITILELGCGTGRLAIPLSEAGASVTAVDVSRSMLIQCRAKEGSERVKFVQADFLEMDLGEQFDAVVFSRNTLLGFAEQRDQIASLRTAALHLAPQGLVYVDIGVPQPDSDTFLSYGGALSDGVVLHQRVHDVFNQLINFRRIIMRADIQPRVIETLSRYIWPAELTLMGELAGLRLAHQWEDFTGRAMTRSSHSCLSVFARG